MISLFTHDEKDLRLVGITSGHKKEVMMKIIYLEKLIANGELKR